MSAPSSSPTMHAALASLREIESLDPVPIRERVIRVMQQIGEGEGASFWSLGVGARGVTPMRLHATGLSNPDVYWSGLRAMDLANPVIDPRRPKRATADRFLPAVASGWVRELATTPYYDSIWRPIRLHDQLRAFLYHDGRFLGTLSTGRFDGSAAFTLRDARRVQAATPAFQAALLSAQAAEIDGGAADLVVRPNGRIDLATATASAWLAMPGFRDRVTAVVHALERGELPGLENLALASVRWSRLHGVGGHSYLLHLASAPLVSIAPDSALSATQRRAAEFLAAGATISETARAMGIGDETVRTHRREIYRRLGVGSRTELANALAGAIGERP